MRSDLQRTVIRFIAMLFLYRARKYFLVLQGLVRDQHTLISKPLCFVSFLSLEISSFLSHTISLASTGDINNSISNPKSLNLRESQKISECLHRFSTCIETAVECDRSVATG